MTLEFRPAFEPDRNRNRESLATLNQTVSGIGEDALRYSQEQKQNKMQQAYLDLAKQKQAREEQDSGPLYNGMDATPQGTTSWNPSPLDIGRQPWAQSPSYGGGTPSGAPSPSASPMGPQPQSPQYASAGTPDTGMTAPAPQQFPQGQPTAQAMHQPGTDLTSHFQAWTAQGQPPTYNHPEMGGIGQSDYSPGMGMDWSQFRRLDKRNREGYSLFNKDRLEMAQAQKALRENDTVEPVVTQADALKAGTVKKGARIINTEANDNRGSVLTDKQLGDAQKAYNSDKNIEKSQAVADKVGEALPLLKAGVVDNATAKQALQTVMTYAATGGMRVNEVELRQFGGANAVSNKIAQWYQGLDKGTLTPRDAKDMTAVLDIFQKSAKKNLQDAGLRYTRQYLQRSQSGEAEPDAYKRVTGRDFEQGGASQGGQGGGMIRVKNKLTGQTGQLPAGNFDATKYDQLQ